MAVKKLTKTVIENLPLPETGQIYVYDEALRGFGVRLSARTRSFFVERRINGRTKRITIARYPEMTVNEARGEARKLLGTMATGIDPVAEKKAAKIKGITLREAFDDFLRARKGLKPITVRDYRCAMDKALKDWQKKPWSSITGEMVAKRHSALGKEHGYATANLSMRVLRAVLNFAMASYRDGQDRPLVAENPVSRLTHTKAWFPVSRKTRLIKAHQLPAWFKAVNELESETARDYLLTVLFTGLRRTEAGCLKWQDIDFKDRSFIVHDTKNKNPLALPLPDFLHELLSVRKTATEKVAKEKNGPVSKYVFPAEGKTGYYSEPRKAIIKIQKDSGVEFSIHDLRRTFVTIAESLDIPAYSLKALLNHKTNAGDVTGGYIQINVERLRKPMQKISESILRMVSSGKEKENAVVPLRLSNVETSSAELVT